MAISKVLNRFGATLAGVMAAGSALAQDSLQGLESIGKPVDGAMGWQPAVTELARDIHWMDNFLLIIITIITVFVTLLLVWVIIRYNRRRNPTPATFTHNTAIEIAWTFIPVLVLIFMVGPSLNRLNKQQIIPEADITIKAIGNQWYWTHEYVDHGFGFDSYMLGHPATMPEGTEGDEFKLSPSVKTLLADKGYSEDEFLLATDTAVVVPVGKTVVVQVTGADVIHSWTIPAFGVKQDAVPGRLAELWFNAEKEGVYFGQCSELCGKDHTYMPITVKVVSEEVYENWLDGAIEEYAGIPRDVKVATAN
ncbi:cytochrome c oxidase subunit 2 [Amylibacter ulvae]|uniref:Cytochrome c oxidase subunit 2 n=1 Tax=Paramylibacter ulvae TaxID=1651968 RepID=A0ABQ3D5W1_9RHOB|nr:cytochrome c oxidase subunit II [Amylibacter ulvae]GHA52480.1 cytochrome c oxidase subunit 2 [Amylibacter ulvae]